MQIGMRGTARKHEASIDGFGLLTLSIGRLRQLGTGCGALARLPSGPLQAKEVGSTPPNRQQPRDDTKISQQ